MCIRFRPTQTAHSTWYLSIVSTSIAEGRRACASAPVAAAAAPPPSPPAASPAAAAAAPPAAAVPDSGTDLVAAGACGA